MQEAGNGSSHPAAQALDPKQSLVGAQRWSALQPSRWDGGEAGQTQNEEKRPCHPQGVIDSVTHVQAQSAKGSPWASLEMEPVRIMMPSTRPQIEAAMVVIPQVKKPAKPSTSWATAMPV